MTINVFQLCPEQPLPLKLLQLCFMMFALLREVSQTHIFTRQLLRYRKLHEVRYKALYKNEDPDPKSRYLQDRIYLSEWV